MDANDRTAAGIFGDIGLQVGGGLVALPRRSGGRSVTLSDLPRLTAVGLVQLLGKAQMLKREIP